jgi:cyclic pyranopterin phosphate synthase
MNNFISSGPNLMLHPHRVSEYMESGDCYPIYMEISPVGNCDHGCIFCAYDIMGYPGRRLKTDTLLDLLDEAAECGLRSVLYSGEGEPLLHPSIVNIIIHTKMRGMDAGLYTNGQLLTDHMSTKILPSLSFLRFSFNGGTRENYAKIHCVKPDVFDKVVHNASHTVRIRNSRGLSVEIGAQYVLVPENIDYLLKGITAMKEASIDYFVVKPFIPNSPAQANKINNELSLDAIDPILDEAEKLSDSDFKVIVRRDSFKKRSQRRYPHCLGTTFMPVLNSAGDIAPCVAYWNREEFVFGNIYNNSFKEIWNGGKRKKIKQLLENKLDLKGCPSDCQPNAINEFLWKAKNT